VLCTDGVARAEVAHAAHVLMLAVLANAGVGYAQSLGSVMGLAGLNMCQLDTHCWWNGLWSGI
jgi:hypothetical protein